MKYLLIILLLFAQAKAQVPYGLNSLPTARPTAFLDFDGQTVNDVYWRPFNGDSIIYCKPTQLTNAQMIRVFNQVAEDYRAFNINITTDSAVYFAAPITRRTRVIITPTWQWYGGTGGVAYIESFRWGLNIPCFVFDTMLSNVDKWVAEAASHEIGHTLGLNHQSQYNSSCAFVTEYSAGIGSGDIGWAPIMGNSYSRNLSLWTNGRTFNCTTFQNDVNIIASSLNGITLRADDVGNTVNTAKAVTVTNGSFLQNAMMNDSVDVDFFRFDLTVPGRFTLNAKPYSPGPSSRSAVNTVGMVNYSSNIDIGLTLIRNNSNIASYNPSTRLDAIIDTLLEPGTYYVRVEAVNNINIQRYAMIGSYTISGTFGGSVTVPIYSLTLKATNNKLEWNIVADEPLDKIWIEVSNTSSNFKVFKYVSGLNGSTTYKQEGYYRLAATTASGETYYSKVIYVKPTVKASYQLVSNQINNNITVNASKTHSWILYDISGKRVSSGVLVNGVNNLQTNIVKGMYILQITDNNTTYTEKIIKL